MTERSEPFFALIRLGKAAWAFVGIVVAVALTASVLTMVSSVVLPLAFAAVLAVLFRPLAARMEDRHLPAPLAAGAVVLLLVGAAAAVVWLTVRGVMTQSDRLLDELDTVLARFDIDADTIDQTRIALKQLSPSVTSGSMRAVVSGVSTLGGFVMGSILSVLIMYYLVKDGPSLRRKIVGKMRTDRSVRFDLFVSDACHVLRRYWLGRTIVSGVVAAVVGIAAALLGLPLVLTITVVTFIGGYIPYLGAIVGGLLAVLVAVGTDGVGAGVAMLAAVLVANLLVENLVEPAITGRTLEIHPLLVVLVTTAGGILGGLVGLVMAVPITVIAIRAYSHLRDAVDFEPGEIVDEVRQAITDVDD